ncbi:MAG: hypothetical protein L0Z53_21750, partial [Acidobacteriales bacterium]|nr:hypothetical protein [Terriglobales bacterium]
MLANGIAAQATDVSADGSVVVGHCDTNAGLRAFRWSEGSGMSQIGDDTSELAATAISEDGTTIVGYSVGRYGAFRWTDEQGVVLLGGLPNGQESNVASDVSADGNVVVGQLVGPKAFIWAAENGLHDLQVLLVENGANLAGWTLTEPQGISADGNTIVGYGLNPSGQGEAWIAKLCEVALTDQPDAQSEFVGSRAVFVAQSNDPTAAFQWRKDQISLFDGGNIFGATSDALTIDPVTMGDAGIYDVVVSNACGSVTSNPATLTVICFGDVAMPADGFVDVIDMLALIYEWGHCPGCPQDLTGDDWVNISDLLALIGAWGACP